jgi:DNA ligase (NAD+)
MRQQQSISELFTEQDLLAFDRETREFLQGPSVLEYVVEPRIVAVEVALIYKEGSLTSASTRTGPVTTSVKTILTVPLTFIPLQKEMTVPDSLEITADVYMEAEAFSLVNQDRTAKKLPAFPDPKAAVEDSLCQTDPRVSAKRPLNYFCSGAGSRTAIQAETQYELMIALQVLGLRVNRPHIKMGRGIHEVIDRCQQLREAKENFPYPLEGALIRVNSLELQERLSHGSGNAHEKVVYRF